MDYEQIRVADELSESVQRAGATLVARNAWLAGEDHGGTAGARRHEVFISWESTRHEVRVES